MFRTRHLVLLLVGVVCGSRIAAAQKIIPEPNTPGVYNPATSIAGDGDAASVERDAASLGFLRGWSANYVHTETDLSGKVGGRGDAGFLAAPVPLLSMLSVGVGLQSIRPPTAFDFSNETKLSVAVAARPFSELSLGATYSHIWADQSGGVNQPRGGNIDTLDLSMSMRMTRYVDSALVVHDVQGGTAGNILLQRVYEPEIAVRPTGTNLLELAVGARFGERRGDIDPRVRVWLRPHGGIALKAELEVRHDLYLDHSELNDLRIAIGAEFDLAHIGASVFGLFGTDDGVARGHGFSVAARLSGERYPALWEGLTHLERVDLGPNQKGRGLTKLLLRLREIAKGNHRAISGVLLVVGDWDGGWAEADELHRALLMLRRSKKHVFVYVTNTTTKSYWLAAAGERVFQDPAGDLHLVGLSQHALYFGGTGEQLGVRADFVKIAEYKSAPEQLTQKQSSAPARQEREALADDLYRTLVADIARARHLTVEATTALIDHGPFTPVEALRAGLVDELATDDDLEHAIGVRLDRRVRLDTAPTSPDRQTSWSERRVAVVYLDGDITDGRSRTIPLLGLSTSGARTIIEALIRARDDYAVRAIVLRIDSPGGSALGSEMIAREIERTRKVKPVICSFSNVAASGGYFAAANCQEIFALPSTITGSIGIFTGKLDLSGLLGKLGVSFETVERGKNASVDSLFRLYTDEERAQLMGELRYAYDRFVGVVARGRGMTPESVDALARGRVWSGDAALANHLVDAHGGLLDALEAAAGLGGLVPDGPLTVEELPPQAGLLAQLVGLLGLGGDDKDERWAPLLSSVAPLVKQLPVSVLLAPSTMQARLLP